MKAWLTSQFEQSHSLQKGLIWYQSRRAGERLWLRCFCFFVVAMVLYVSVMKPLQEHYESAAQRLSIAQDQYQRLQTNVQKLVFSKVGQNWQDRDTDALRRVLSQTASAAQFSADRVQVDGDSRLQIWASNVSFTVVAKWFEGLSQNGVALTSLQLERVGEGKVNLRLTMD